jgi:transcriptional regulator with XRE-family HTH domain
MAKYSNMNQFGERIRKLREQNGTRQRELAALLETDSAYISKLENGERKAKREQVLLLAGFFKVDKEELLSLWLGGKVYDVLKNEDVAKQALKVAEKNIDINKKNKSKNGKNG